MGKEILDFEADLPSEIRVEGYDAFQERGRFLLFIEMIGSIAHDLCLPQEDPNYQDSLQWLNNPANMLDWIDMIDGSEDVAPILQKAIHDRPGVIAGACATVVRGSQGDSGSFQSFMRAMGVKDTRSGSSLQVDPEDHDYYANSPG